MLNPAIFEFLDAIAEYNTREYFAKVKPLYKEILLSVSNLCQELIDKTWMQHEEVRPLLPKDCLFRVYRDARRLKKWDPLYKHNFWFTISPTGKKNLLSWYYIHLERGKSFFASGVYWPSSNDLLAIRNRLKTDGKTYLELTKKRSFVKRFGEVEWTSLKRPPRWFNHYDPYMDLLKKKQHLVRASYDDTLVLSDWFVDAIMKDVALVKPWSDWLAGDFEA